MSDQPELPFTPAPTESPEGMSAASSLNAMPGISSSPLRAAEFFAGIGLVRMALQRVGVDVVWANDIEPIKERVYTENFGNADFRLGDIRQLEGSDLPDVDVATASFPCTDLSLAGWRRGLAGSGSGMFWSSLVSFRKWVPGVHRRSFWRMYLDLPRRTVAPIFERLSSASTIWVTGATCCRSMLGTLCHRAALACS